MEANRQNHLAPNNKGLWRAVSKYFMSTAASTAAMATAAQQAYQPTFNYPGTWPTQVVEIREEKYAVFYRDRKDKPTRNTVQGIILRDEETGAEIKMTLEELAVAAGMKW